MLGVAFIETVFFTVIDVFGFEDNAVNSLEVEFDAASNRHGKVVRQIHQSSFAKQREEVWNDRSADLQGCIVENLCIAVVNLVKDVAAVAELDIEQFKAREVVEVEYDAEVTLVEVGSLADEGKGDVHVFVGDEAEFKLVFRILGRKEAVLVAIDVATEVVSVLVSVVPTTDLEAKPVLALVSPSFVEREVIFDAAHFFVDVVGL